MAKSDFRTTIQCPACAFPHSFRLGLVLSRKPGLVSLERWKRELLALKKPRFFWLTFTPPRGRRAPDFGKFSDLQGAPPQVALNRTVALVTTCASCTP